MLLGLAAAAAAAAAAATAAASSGGADSGSIGVAGGGGGEGEDARGVMLGEAGFWSGRDEGMVLAGAGLGGRDEGMVLAGAGLGLLAEEPADLLLDDAEYRMKRSSLSLTEAETMSPTFIFLFLQSRAVRGWLG